MDTNEHVVNGAGVQKSPIGARIREERLRLGMSQAVFANLLGVHRRTQINYESCTRKPDTDYLEALAKAQVDVGYVLTGESEFRNLQVLRDILGHIREELELGAGFDQEWLDVFTQTRKDLLDFYQEKPDSSKGLAAVRRLLKKSPVLFSGADDLAELLNQIEFVADADGAKLGPERKARVLVSLFRQRKNSGLKFVDLKMVRDAIQAVI